MLDTTMNPALDLDLVLCGPKATSYTSKGGLRPWSIANVYLFDAGELCADRQARGTSPGVASSVRAELWDAAEIYPTAVCDKLRVSPNHAAALQLFAL